MKQWICSQFSSREKYAIPRALLQNQQLQKMYTDLWIKPGSIVSILNRRSNERYHPDLENVNVEHFNFKFLKNKLSEKVFKKELALDKYYDQVVAQCLKDYKKEAELFFGYSYASRTSFKIAKSKGLITVMGQINPGPVEADLVIEEYKKYKGGAFKPFVPDNNYWDLWREEASYADRIIVNSEWSRKLLVQGGIPENKCVIVPLAYEQDERQFERRFKEVFSDKRPLQILYLGGIEIRKGLHILIEAMKCLVGMPVELKVVGSLKGPIALLENLPSNVHYCDAVTPAKVDTYYKEADIFILPTLSDGFGLTQLEAQSYKLPIITTKYCANVVCNEINGIILDEVSVSGIKDAIAEVIDNPGLLERWSSKSVSMQDYSIQKLAGHLSKF